MDIIQEFKKLAVQLQKEDALVYLDQAKKMNDMDQELQEVIGEFNITRYNLNAELMKSEKDEAKVDELNEKLNDLYSQIMHNENMINYNQAKEEVELIVQHIQAIVAAAVNGADPMTVELPEEGCSGSCSTCGGCH